MKPWVGWVMRRAGQLALLVVAGILVAVLLDWFDTYAETHTVPSGRWVAMAFFTVLVFWAVLADFRRSWRRPGFWAWIAGLLLLHMALYVAVLLAVGEWRVIWSFLFSLVEFPLLASVLRSLGYEDRPRTSRRSVRCV